jgi:protein O-mannosyl-transferase
MYATSDSRFKLLYRRYRSALLYALIACITITAFIPSLKNGFVNRDDPAYVTNNLDIRGFNHHTLAKIFSSVYINQYIPATMLSYMTDYGLFGLDPAAFHRTGLFLHCLNCLLVLALFYRLSGNYFIGAVTALLFAIHPMRVEAVAWTAERKEVLSAFFYFISLLCYLSFIKKGVKKYYLLCMLSLLLSLLSKTMAVSQPFVLVLIDYLTGRAVNRKSLLEKLPFFALSAAFAVNAVLTLGRVISYDFFSNYSPAERALMPAWAMAQYLFKTVVPVNLCASYYLPDVPAKNLIIIMALCTALVAALAAIVCLSRRFSRKAVFGSLFFLVTLLPVLQIVNSGGLVLIADRYTYVPMLGLYFIAAAGLAFVMREKLKDSAPAKAAVYAGLAAAVTALSWLTWQRCGVWNNSLTLWNDTIKKFPAAAQAYDGRASAFRDMGEYDRALADYNRALELKPDFAGGYFGRGYIYCGFLGRSDEAVADLKRAVALAPDFPDAWNALGVAYGMKGSCGLAVAGFDRAIALKPDFAEAYVNRAFALMNCAKDADRAIADVSRAIALDPAFAKAYLLRGIARAATGHYDPAIADFDRAMQLDPRNSAQAAQYRARALAERDKFLHNQ